MELTCNYIEGRIEGVRNDLETLMENRQKLYCLNKDFPSIRNDLEIRRTINSINNLNGRLLILEEVKSVLKTPVKKKKIEFGPVKKIEFEPLNKINLLTFHALKTEPKAFNDTATGNKLFEIRKNDRNFKINDIIILQEYISAQKEYTGKFVIAKVTSIYDYEQKEGYVVLGIKPIFVEE